MAIINVRDSPYNAKGDGTTNDRPAIQLALDTAVAGDVVYVPRQDVGDYYKITNVPQSPQINLRMRTSGVSFIADPGTRMHVDNGGRLIAIASDTMLETEMNDVRDAGYAVANPTQGSAVISLDNPSHANNFSVDDSVLVATDTGLGDAPYLFQRMTLKSKSGGDLTMYESWAIVVPPGTTWSAAVVNDEVSDVTIQDFTLASPLGACNALLFANWTRNLKVLDVQCEDAGGIGMTINNTVRSLIRDAIIDGVSHGIALAATWDSLVKGCDIARGSKLGIFCDAPNGMIKILGNTVSDNVMVGLQLSRTFHSVVVGNLLRGNGTSAPDKAQLALKSSRYTSLVANQVMGLGTSSGDPGVMAYWDNQPDPSWYEAAHLTMAANVATGCDPGYLGQYPGVPASAVTDVTNDSSNRWG